MTAVCSLLLALLVLALLRCPSVSGFDVSAYDEQWTDSSDRETESMPLGNGDLTLMLWLERSSGDLLYYAQSAAAYEENGQLMKLIRGRLHLSSSSGSPPAPPAPSVVRHRLHLLNASQTLEYDLGSLHVSVLVWVDRWRQVAHFNVSTSAPVQAVNAVEMWRTQPTTQDWWTWGYWSAHCSCNHADRCPARQTRQRQCGASSPPRCLSLCQVRQQQDGGPRRAVHGLWHGRRCGRAALVSPQRPAAGRQPQLRLVAASPVAGRHRAGGAQPAAQPHLRRLHHAPRQRGEALEPRRSRARRLRADGLSL